MHIILTLHVHVRIEKEDESESQTLYQQRRSVKGNSGETGLESQSGLGRTRGRSVDHKGFDPNFISDIVYVIIRSKYYNCIFKTKGIHVALHVLRPSL